MQKNLQNAITFLPYNTAVSLYSAANIIVKTPPPAVQTPNPNFQTYQLIDRAFTHFFSQNIYLSSLELPDNVFDACLQHVLKGGAKILIDAARTLAEVGRFDVKHRLSPIMYLHQNGLLSNSQIAGGIYLDKDDVDLMVQENARLILTPSFDAGRGNGIPPLRMYLERGLKIHLGTMDNTFNAAADILYEAQILRLLVNGSMCAPIITQAELQPLITGSAFPTQEE
ncbi:MAG: hypothetical protein FWH03_04055 [Firmicutes bacterium]|nr:hypothetical protein [Bacillota bacterium]